MIFGPRREPNRPVKTHTRVLLLMHKDKWESGKGKDKRKGKGGYMDTM